MQKNALYLTGGGGTTVINTTLWGVARHLLDNYPDNIGTLYAAVGGLRGAIHEDLTDVLARAGTDRRKLSSLQWPASPVFGTSRYKPTDQDLRRLLQVCEAHNIGYVFFNGGNDTMEKAVLLSRFAKQSSCEIAIVGLPKTIDNDLLGTHRSPGYASYAKQQIISAASVFADVESFAPPPSATRKPIAEGGCGQIMIAMGRDCGWGAIPPAALRVCEDDMPNVVLTPEGGYNETKFLDRCQNLWDNYGYLALLQAKE